MNAKDLIAGTFASLWANKLRTFLSMFGIAWGIVSITLMAGAAEGLRVGQARVMEGLGRDLMIVFSGRTSLQAGGQRAGRAVKWRFHDAAVIRAEAVSCQFVLPEVGRGGSPIKSRYNSASQLVVGSLPEFAYLRSIDIHRGRFYNQKDVREARRVVFLGSDLAKQLFGSRNPVEETVQIRGVPYQVIGAMRPKTQDSSYDGQDVQKAFIPITALLRDFPVPPPAEPDQIDRLLTAPRSLEHHPACESQVRRSLARLHGFDPRDEEAVPIWDTVENSKRTRAMTDGMKYFLGAIGVVTLLLGGIGVMNVMLVTVRERTREIGIRKAVGATSGSILAQFFFEGLIAVSVSGIVGVSLAFALCRIVNNLDLPPFFAGLLPPWEATLVTAVLLGAVGVVSGLYPAYRAAGVDPVQALYFEAGG